MLLFFQNVALCHLVSAAGVFGSRPPGPNAAGQPMGAMEVNKQERIQRPGERMSESTFMKTGCKM